MKIQMMTRVRRWGNSLGLRLPKGAAQEAGVVDGSPVDVRVEGGSIVVRPVQPRRYRLTELLSEVTPANRHGEADLGRPRGRELL